VRSKATYSERLVKTRIGEARYQARNLFWIDVVPVEGVADEDPEPPRTPAPWPYRKGTPRAEAAI
jgi:hypothetical protein